MGGGVFRYQLTSAAGTLVCVSRCAGLRAFSNPIQEDGEACGSVSRSDSYRSPPLKPVLQAAPGRLGRRQRSGGGASAPSGMLLFLVALHVAPLERFEGCRGVVSLLVETIFSEQGYDEP